MAEETFDEYRQKINQQVSTTAQEVANRIHPLMGGSGGTHEMIHSCPCYGFALYYLGLSGFPNLYWPDGEGGNAWGKASPEIEQPST